MTTFSQSITFSKDNFDSINTIKRINYNHIVLAGDKLWSTTYKNKIDDKSINETFNKLHKDGTDIYEKIGNCQNKNSWIVKEFFNTNLKKEYNTSYDKNNFTNTIIDAINNIHETSGEYKLIK
jgi:hypothetical protein|tara:strand:- start:89 stop:457 length:369 start_codon:yes stop_codon:yes gene_type:complete